MFRLSLGGIISHRIQFTLGEGKLRKLVQLSLCLRMKPSESKSWKPDLQKSVPKTTD